MGLGNTLRADAFSRVALEVLSRGSINREATHNSCAAVKLGNKGNIAAVKFREALDDGQAKPRPAVAARQGFGLKSLEGLFLEFRVNAPARVGNPDLDICARAPGPHADLAASGRKPDGI